MGKKRSPESPESLKSPNAIHACDYSRTGVPINEQVLRVLPPELQEFATPPNWSPQYAATLARVGLGLFARQPDALSLAHDTDLTVHLHGPRPGIKEDAGYTGKNDALSVHSTSIRGPVVLIDAMAIEPDKIPAPRRREDSLYVCTPSGGTGVYIPGKTYFYDRNTDTVSDKPIRYAA